MAPSVCTALSKKKKKPKINPGFNAFETGRWNLATHNASVCQHFCVVAGTNLIARLHVHELLSKDVSGH